MLVREEMAEEVLKGKMCEYNCKKKRKNSEESNDIVR